jgi:hypothetical protein
VRPPATVIRITGSSEGSISYTAASSRNGAMNIALQTAMVDFGISLDDTSFSPCRIDVTTSRLDN